MKKDLDPDRRSSVPWTDRQADRQADRQKDTGSFSVFRRAPEERAGFVTEVSV
jgi:hypothetical protein